MNFKYLIILVASIALNTFLISEVVFNGWINQAKLDAQKEMFYLMKNMAEAEKAINLQILGDQGVEESINLILEDEQ